MDAKPVIFISYSQKHSELKDFFEQLIEDMGFHKEVFDAGSAMSVLETQEVLIKKCDGFIGILTPDIETAGGYICSPAVITEISFAYSAKKPIQLFSVNGVDLSGVQFSQVNTITKLTTYAAPPTHPVLAFDAKNIRQIFRTLIDFKKHIDELYHQKLPTPQPVFLYKQFEIRQDILSSEHLQIRNSVEAIAQRDVDKHIHAARLLFDTGTKDGITIKKENFQFKLLKPTDNSADIDMIDNGSSSFRFSINFKRPVSKYTPVKYAFERRYSNYFPYTREKLEEVLKAGKVKSRIMEETRMIGQDFYVTQPTEVVRFVLSFPKGYPISRYTAAACYGKGELIHKAETDRVEALAQLDHNEFDDQYTLTLSIPNPHLDMTYLLLYEPPKADMLAGKG